MIAGHNLAGGHSEGRVNTLLHIATISGVLASLMRHFRASLSSLPLLAQAISNLPIGTWSPDAELPALEGNFAEVDLSTVRLSTTVMTREVAETSIIINSRSGLRSGCLSGYQFLKYGN